MAEDAGLIGRLTGDVRAADYAILYLTSGATGEPKMGLVTHGAVVANVDLGPSVVDIGPRDRSIASIHRRTRSDGRVLEVRSDPTPDGGFVVTYTDVTNQTEAEESLRAAKEQAEAASRAKSQFLATMSHELRTPLNSIIGFSDVLGSIPSLDERQKRYVQNIQKSGKMLLDMINDILDLAKIESGKMELRPSEFRLEHVVHAQCDMARPLTERKNLDLTIDVEPGLAVYQDQGKVQQILNNLLSNAIKFTPDGGRIGVAARAVDGQCFELVVSDTGVGIAEADQSHIFEKFRQGRTVMPSGDALTREYSGTGLGLSIVKELGPLMVAMICTGRAGSAFAAELGTMKAGEIGRASCRERV